MTAISFDGSFFAALQNQIHFVLEAMHDSACASSHSTLAIHMIALITTMSGYLA